jgi:RNA polymerase-binding transcription factor DksA
MAKSVPKKAAAPAKKTAAPEPKATVRKSTTKPTTAEAASAKSAPAKKAAPAKQAEPAKKAQPTKATVKAPSKAAPVKKAAPAKEPEAKRRGPNPFDAKFLDAQRKLLLEERAKALSQADHLDAEAAALMEDLDPGDVQFDDESGEGDTLVVERERDLALAGQARQTVVDIDAALLRIDEGTYGFSVISGKPIPKERLKAIPWATELVEEKVGGLGSRR